MDGRGWNPVRTRIRGRAKSAELIAFVLALEERDRQDESERRRIDREVRREAKGATGLALLRAWLERAPGPSLGRRLDRVARLLGTLRWLLVTVGFFLGWAATAALLSIEVHEGRINVVLFLALLVGLPLGLLVLSGVGWVVSLRSGRSRGGRPSIGDWLRNAGFGRLVMKVSPPGLRSDLEVLFGRWKAHGNLHGRVQRDQLLVWSQILGLGFGVGSLAATLVFVVFTDLAFGWSTTLDVDPALVHHALAFMARPWGWLWPDASPSLELVESTRFFRVASADAIRFVDPILYGGWWPFLVMAIGFYSILPRLLFLAVLDRALSREVTRTIARTPGVERLLDRLETPVVESRADRAEGRTGRAEGGLVPEVDVQQWLADCEGASVSLVRWSEAASEERIRAIPGFRDQTIHEAGGRRSLEDDGAVVLGAADRGQAVAVMVRAWEPPLLDLLDFLSNLRMALGRDPSICVVLFDGDEEKRAAWRRKLSGLGDPRLRVARMGPTGDG